MSWTDDPELTRYTVFLHIDASKPTDNVTIDFGVIPPSMAFDAIRQAYDAVCELLEDERPLMFFRQSLVESPLVAVDPDDD